MELMLRAGNHNVYVTDLGEEAIDLAKNYDYDIMLLDLNLPDMSGYEVLRALRDNKVKTPVMIVSGMAGIEDKVKGFALGADDYLTKPFYKDELVARICPKAISSPFQRARAVHHSGRQSGYQFRPARPVKSAVKRFVLHAQNIKCWSFWLCAKG